MVFEASTGSVSNCLPPRGGVFGRDVTQLGAGDLRDWGRQTMWSLKYSGTCPNLMCSIKTGCLWLSAAATNNSGLGVAHRQHHRLAPWIVSCQTAQCTSVEHRGSLHPRAPQSQPDQMIHDLPNGSVKPTHNVHKQMAHAMIARSMTRSEAMAHSKAKGAVGLERHKLRTKSVYRPGRRTGETRRMR